MRRVSVLLVIGLLLIPPLAAAAGNPLTLVHYGPDLQLREQLIGQISVFADLGGRLVARVDDPTRARLAGHGIRLRRIAEPGPADVLARIVRTANYRPAGVRVLLEEPDLFLVAGSPAAVDALRRPGLPDGGVMPIALDAPYRRTPSIQQSYVDAPDPQVTTLVGQVQKQNLINHIKALSAIYTRNARRSENAQAIKYVKDELAKLSGLTVKTESFSSTYGPNVIAELKGTGKPTEIVFVGAHIDSRVSSTSGRSPGADDNASGSAAVLEIVRIFTSGVPMQRTLRFGWWNAEEYGLIGSNAYAQAAKTRGDRIIAYLNTDMNAYRASGDTVDVDFILNDSTPSLVTQLTQISQTYVPTLGVKSGYFSRGTSDHRSFYRNGFPAVFYFEDIDKYSPYIHSANDDMTLSANDMDLSTLITRSIVAGLATLAEPLPVPTFTLSVTSGPTVGGTKVTATGNNLDGITSVKVAGKTVPFTQGSGAVTFETPTSAATGQVPVEIANPTGAGKGSFTYVLTSPPALRLPTALKPGQFTTGAIGGNPGHVTVTLFSLLLGKTDMGLITLDIGGGSPGNLFYYHVGVLVPGGGITVFPIGVPNEPKLVGYAFHFQTAVVEPTLKSIDKTNIATVNVTK
jgi:hypothetical protein